MVGDNTPGGLVDLHDVAALSQMDVIVQIFCGHWDAGCYPGFLEDSEGLSGCEGLGPFAEELVKFLSMFFPSSVGGELGVGGPGRLPDYPYHTLPFVVALAGDDNPVVLAPAGVASIRSVGGT